MEELTGIIQEATRKIAGNFFQLPIDGGTPVYRERVYCYELYHQMRHRWPPNCPYCLNGEVDKHGHPLLKELNAHKCIPDLLVHRPGPGGMAHNHAIIEVKSCNLDRNGIRKDIGTLTKFLTVQVGYERGIFLIFGRDLTDCRRNQIHEEIARANSNHPIELWHHSVVGQAAEKIWPQENPTHPHPRP